MQMNVLPPGFAFDDEERPREKKESLKDIYRDFVRNPIPLPVWMWNVIVIAIQIGFVLFLFWLAAFVLALILGVSFGI